MNNNLRQCPYADALDEYLFGRLSDAETAQVTVHLLVCATCCEDLATSVRFCLAMKALSIEDAHYNVLSTAV
jgi:hypothetical protein